MLMDSVSHGINNVCKLQDLLYFFIKMKNTDITCPVGGGESGVLKRSKYLTQVWMRGMIMGKEVRGTTFLYFLFWPHLVA